MSDFFFKINIGILITLLLYTGMIFYYDCKINKNRVDMEIKSFQMKNSIVLIINKDENKLISLIPNKLLNK